MPPTGLPQPLRNGFNPLHDMYMFHIGQTATGAQSSGRARDTADVASDRQTVANCGNLVEERGLRHAGARAAEERKSLKVHKGELPTDGKLPVTWLETARSRSPAAGQDLRNGAAGRAAAEETLRNGAWAPKSCFLNARD